MRIKKNKNPTKALVGIGEITSYSIKRAEVRWIRNFTWMSTEIMTSVLSSFPIIADTPAATISMITRKSLNCEKKIITGD